MYMRGAERPLYGFDTQSLSVVTSNQSTALDNGIYN
jgi:hypothetical protein